MLGGQQALGLLDHRADSLARSADQVGTQRLDKAVEQRRIVSRRQHQVGTAGIGDQGVAGTGAALDQVVELVLDRFQASR
ncbi:hypothetical protein D3C87_1507510 [compost metagenome]